jgi:uncharacterized protein (UPF0332 family)
LPDPQLELLRKAKESLTVARNNLDQGFPGFAAARAYYAMFYAIEAMLLNLGLAYSKHSAVISAFAQRFIKTGQFPVEFHSFLREAFKDRMTGDYDALREITAEQAEIHINRANEIVKTIENRIKGDSQ